MSARVGTMLFLCLGLIGGSLAAALRGTGFAARMTAFNRNRATLDYALGGGLIDAAPASLEEAIDEAELIAHCRDVLARFKVPRAIHAVDTLPRNAVGKVTKDVLRRRLHSVS